MIDPEQFDLDQVAEQARRIGGRLIVEDGTTESGLEHPTDGSRQARRSSEALSLFRDEFDEGAELEVASDESNETEESDEHPYADGGATEGTQGIDEDSFAEGMATEGMQENEERPFAERTATLGEPPRYTLSGIRNGERYSRVSKAFASLSAPNVSVFGSNESVRPSR